MVRTLSAALLVAVLVSMTWGCAPDAPSTEGLAEPTEVDASRDEESGGIDSGEPRDDAQPVEVIAPSVAEAEAAVLRVAAEAYPEASWVSAEVEGIGLDASGLWWVQAWTSTGREGDESEQWFITYDGDAWEYHDSGTGMDRADYPSDIVWEDVE